MSEPSPPEAMTPWLSILLPVFNVGPPLDDCLRSILDQDVDGIELVLLDDASSNSDSMRLAQWQQGRPDLVHVVTHARNLGVSAARNTLLAKACGTYLWFVDPDDVMESGALAALRTIVESQAPDIVVCDFRTFADLPRTPHSPPSVSVLRSHVATFEGRSNELSRSGEHLVRGLFRTGQFHPWTKIVRRDAWPANLRFPEGRLFEDLAVFPRLVLGTPVHIHVPHVWISYRQRDGSAVATLDEKKLEDWTVALTGFAHDLRASTLRPDADTLFEVAHFCARTLLRAIRRDARLHAPIGRRERLRRYVERWRDSSPMDAKTLARAYLERRMFGRWAQWRWTMQHLAV